jgi:hypothetical protein
LRGRRFDDVHRGSGARDRVFRRDHGRAAACSARRPDPDSQSPFSFGTIKRRPARPPEIPAEGRPCARHLRLRPCRPTDAFGNALGDSIVANSQSSVDWSNAPDQSDAETARLNRYAAATTGSSTRPSLLASAAQVVSDAGSGMPAEIISLVPYRHTAESDASLLAFVQALSNSNVPAGPRITLDDFGNPARTPDTFEADVDRENYLLASRSRTISSTSTAGMVSEAGKNYFLINRDESGLGVYQDIDLSRIATGAPSEPAGALRLGVNERYRAAIELAEARTGVPAATIAAVFSAEAATVRSGEDRGLWDPNSYNEQSRALGLTQFLGTTWLGEATTRGTYLNEHARAAGLVDDRNRVTNQDALLDLRRDPTLSIVAAAEYDTRILRSLERQTQADGTPLIPRNLTDTDRAHLLYIGHHEGEAGARAVLTGEVSEDRARNTLMRQNMSRAQQTAYLAQNDGNAGRAYTQWLWDYTRTRVDPARFMGDRPGR